MPKKDSSQALMVYLPEDVAIMFSRHLAANPRLSRSKAALILLEKALVQELGVAS